MDEDVRGVVGVVVPAGRLPRQPVGLRKAEADRSQAFRPAGLDHPIAGRREQTADEEESQRNQACHERNESVRYE